MFSTGGDAQNGYFLGLSQKGVIPPLVSAGKPLFKAAPIIFKGEGCTNIFWVREEAAP